MTTSIKFKQALRDQLSDLPAFEGVQVVYGDPGATARREVIWVGEIWREDQSLVGISPRPSATRDEEYEVRVHVQVSSKAKPEACEDRLGELISEIEFMLAQDPKIQNVPGVLWATVTELRITSKETGDGPYAHGIITITVRARY